MSTSSLDQLELQLEELEASADPHAAEQKFSAPAGASRIRTCMGLFLSSGCFGFC